MPELLPGQTAGETALRSSPMSGRNQEPVIDADTAFGLTDREHLTEKLISSFRLHALFTIAGIRSRRSMPQWLPTARLPVRPYRKTRETCRGGHPRSICSASTVRPPCERAECIRPMPPEMLAACRGIVGCAQCMRRIAGALIRRYEIPNRGGAMWDRHGPG